MDDSALKDVRAQILTPAYGDQVTVAYTQSMMALVNACWSRGMIMKIAVENGQSLITRARNEMLVKFLDTPELTHVFWIDADVGFRSEDVFRFLSSDLDVVAGAYPIKQYDWPIDIPAGTQTLSQEQFERLALVYPVNANEDAGLSFIPDEDGYLEVTEAPTGFMCIKRRVFDRMMEAYPDLQYFPDFDMQPGREAKAKYCYRFFDVMFDASSKRYLSEDYAFCRRWRDIGGKVHVCTRTRLTHAGTHRFNGDIQGALAVRPLEAIGGRRGRRTPEERGR
ncbi:hypothetical protein [Bradyrhizobium brasilense]|uniref:hypothetical protein n=1 Tax=Bradyrhizobium brasilense TaxID=1419277 RepID=UPI000B884605|nr:hypothetical protein [Bradyrhizobium brasilense]